MKIKVINSNTGQVKLHTTEAGTWGELKAEISDMFTGNVNGVIRETSNTLQVEGALLPDEKLTDESKDWDYTLFFVTAESKAGADYSDWDFHALRREVSRRGYNNNGRTRTELIEILVSSDPQEQETSNSQLDRIEAMLTDLIDLFSVITIEFSEEDETEVEIEEDEIRFIENFQ